jgi:hypothetical protein
MKRGLILAAAIVLIANASALIHAGRNRSGGAEADITLTQRELSWPLSEVNEDDSEIAPRLLWNYPQPLLVEPQPPWLDEKTLRALGFDTSVAPSDGQASEFYQRQRARRAFVALEYDGPAWRKKIEELERRFQEHPDYVRPSDNDPKRQRESATRLIAIDASRDAAQLRARNPDRGVVIIVPAVIFIVLEPYMTKVRQSGAERPARIVGSIRDIPSSIHIPRPYSDVFRSGGIRARHGDGEVAEYRVHLRYGTSFEPWVVDVQVLPPSTR